MIIIDPAMLIFQYLIVVQHRSEIVHGVVFSFCNAVLVEFGY